MNHEQNDFDSVGVDFECLSNSDLDYFPIIIGVCCSVGVLACFILLYNILC